jgi:hypothetical protein
MNNSVSKSKSLRNCRYAAVVVGVLSCILLATAGALVLSGCGTTRQGVQREQGLYLVASNALNSVSAFAPYTPPPISPLLEGVTALGGALLAVWASHLHRSVRALENGSRNGQANGAPPTAPPGKA